MVYQVAPLPGYLQQAYNEDPRVQLANQLAASGMQTTPTSWAGGLARLAQTLVGSYNGNQIRQNYQNQAADYRTQLAQALTSGDPTKALSDSSNPELQQMGLQFQLQRAARAPQEIWHTLTPDEIKAHGLNPRGSYEGSNFGATRTVQAPMMPTIEHINEGGNEVTYQLDPYTGNRTPIATAPRQLLAPPEAQRDYEFAKSQGFNGSFLDFIQAKGQAASGPFGSSDNGKALTILTRGDPSTPEYASAYWLMSQPHVTIDQATGQMIMQTPNMSQFKAPTHPITTQGANVPPPAVGGNPAAPGQAGGQPLPTPPAAVPAAPNAPQQTLQQPVAPDSRQPNITVQQVPGMPGKSPSDEQAKAGGFFDRMSAAEQNISKNQNVGTDYTQEYLSKIPVIGNALVSGEKQSLSQAELDWLTAQLRRESGAVIGPSEIENAKLQYFPQPGDKPETLAQKAANRKTAMEAMKKSAGQYYKFNTPTDSGGAVDYKSKYGLQ